MRGLSDATSRNGWGSQTEATVSTMDTPIQNPECPELIPVSPLGAYDGREKWAVVESMGASVGANSLTTPSWRDEAQAESSHAITKASIPNHAAPLFTRANLLITKRDANSGT